MTCLSNPIVVTGKLLDSQPKNEAFVELLYLEGFAIRRREGVRRFSQLLSLMANNPGTTYQLPYRDRVALFTKEAISPTFVTLLDRLRATGLVTSDKAKGNYKFGLSDDFALKLQGAESNG